MPGSQHITPAAARLTPETPCDPVFRIVLGAALIAAGVALHLIGLAVVGGLLLVMGLAALVFYRRRRQAPQPS